MLLVQDQYLFEFEGVADCAYLTLSDILNIRKHALMKRFAFSRLGSVRVKLTFDQARCDQASLRVQLPSEFKSEMPRSELNPLPTRLHEEFNQHLRIKLALNLAGFVAQTFWVLSSHFVRR